MAGTTAMPEAESNGLQASELPQPAQGRHEPGRARRYLWTGLVTFTLTALEIAALQAGLTAGVAKPFILAFMTGNLLLAAFLYQGLKEEGSLIRLVFGIGLSLGLMAALSLTLLLRLGLGGV